MKTSKTTSMSSVHDTSMLLVLTAVGVLWLRSSLGKLMAGDFVQNLGGTLTKFASNNPYPWFKEILTTQAIPNAEFMGMVVMGSELLVACLVTFGALYLLFMKSSRGLISMLLGCGLLVGIFLNILFWLAAGYTSSSTDGLNILMIVVEVAGLLYLTKISLS